MPRPLLYGYRGDVSGALGELDGRLRQAGWLRAWAHAVGREGRGLFGLVVLASYLTAWLTLVPLQSSPWIGLLAIHTVYAALVWALIQWSTDMPVFSLGRVRRLRAWLERLTLALPVGTLVELDSSLGSADCERPWSRCGEPWLWTVFHLPDRLSISLRVTDGRACPAVRRRVQPGVRLYILSIDRELEMPRLLRMARALKRMALPEGYVTRTVEVSRPGRLVWTLEQNIDDTRDELPLWPLIRLARANASPHATAPATAAALVAPAAQANALAAAASAAEGVLPLRWRGSSGGEELLQEANDAMRRAVRHPALTLASALLALNGALGAALMTLEAFTLRPGFDAYKNAAVLTSSAFGEGWMWAFAAAACCGAAALVPTLLRLHREARRPTPSQPTGALAFEPAGLAIRGPDASRWEQRIDFTRDFGVDLTRDIIATRTPGHVRVHVTLRQHIDGAPPGECVVVGLTSEVEATEHVATLPLLRAEYPELAPHDFLRLWSTVEEAARTTHGEAPRLHNAYSQKRA